MHAEQVTFQLAILGITAKISGPNLKLEGPLGRLTPELREAIRENKDELWHGLYVGEERFCIANEHLLPPIDADWDAWFQSLPIPQDPPVVLAQKKETKAHRVRPSEQQRRLLDD